MSSLPILNSQTSHSNKIDARNTSNNAPGADDIAAGAAPFGELLARQLSPQGTDPRSNLLKTLSLAEGDTLPLDANIIRDIAAADQGSAGITIPADLLASLQQTVQRLSRPTTTDTPAADATTTDAEILPVDDASTDPRTLNAARLPDGQTDLHGTHINESSQRQAGTRENRASRTAAGTETSFTAALQAETGSSNVSTASRSETPNLTAVTSSFSAVGPSAVVSAPVSTQQAVSTTTTISTPLNQPQWSEDFSQKVTWMATQRTQSAELHLNPAQLGPLEVSLKLNGDQATLQFTSAHAAVRDAIEQSIPRLRDMLADSGISLGNTTVSDQAPREQQQRGQLNGTNQVDDNDNSVESDMQQLQTTTRVSRHDGMVDTFV